MNTRKKGTLITVVSVLILALVLGVTAVLAQTDDQDSEPDTDTPTPAEPWLGHRGFHGGFEGMTAKDELLAAELGIEVEELQAAREAAWEKAREAAIEQGLPGFRGHHGFGDGDEYLSLLADELDGVDVEELQAAMEAAHAAWLAQLVDEGYLTQEQADLMVGQQALKAYIDREALAAKALGLSVEELQAAREDGTSLSDLLEEQGLTFETYGEALQQAHEEAVAQAVEDGVIDGDLADEILSNGFGMRGFGGPHGSGPHGFGSGPHGFGKRGDGMHGFGGMRGFPGGGFGNFSAPSDAPTTGTGASA